MVVVPLVATDGANAAPLKAELNLTSFSPISVEDGKTVRASGTFTTNKNLADVVVQLEVGNTAFFSRSAVTEAASTPPFTSPVFDATDDLRRVRKGETVPFRIAFPAENLPFFDPGVFPMRIVASDGVTGEVLASVSTFLPWSPSGVGPAPSRLLMIWPLIGNAEFTTAGADESVDRAALFNTAMSPGGRLETLVTEGARARATWVVDPALIDQADELGTPSAEDFLNGVADEAHEEHVVALPYGDPDVAAVAAAGRPGVLVEGDEKAARVFDRLLAATPRTDLSWPADGAGDEQTITTSGRAGDNFVLLDAENVPLVTPEDYTPSGRIDWPDPELDVLLADEAASALAASPAGTAEDVLLARQRFLAETLLHALELNDVEGRLLVVAPPRRWDPSPSWAEALVDGIRHANWLDSVGLEEAVKPTVVPYVRDAPAIPEDSAARQLPASMVTNAQSALLDNRRLAAILTRPGKVAPPIEDDLFTSISTAWRTDRVAAEEAQDATVDHLSDLRSKVRIVSRGGTLADDRGSFPVTVRNQLDQAVVVTLDVTSTDPLRLRVTGPDDRIRVAAEGSESRQVELDAVTSGRLSFEAQLKTPRGLPYDDPVTVSVDVRGFGRITLVVFGAAAGLLIIAAGLRIVRRIRNARRNAT